MDGANGTSNGILWQISGTKMTAYNALTLKSIYNTGQASGKRDTLPKVAHFATAVPINGKVYVGTTTSLVTYRLLSQP